MITNLTELVFILDRSGSMAGLEGDTIGGFNAMLDKQKAEPGQVRVTTVLFDNDYDILHDRLDLQALQPMTDKHYFVRGSTALLDAIGRTILKVDGVMAASAPEYRADKILFVIITDGMENASHRYTREQISALVSARREMGWEFLFLGANMDAITVARGMGIPSSRAQTYQNDGEGVNINFSAVSDATMYMRRNSRVNDDWDERIRARKERGGKKA